MSGFRFESPWILLWILPVCLLWAWRYFRRKPAILYSSVDSLKGLPVTFRQLCRAALPWFFLLSLLLMVVALARPQTGREESRIRKEGIAIQMCIDKSGSMQAMDFSLNGKNVNRLEAVKDVFRRFAAGDDRFDGRPDDLIGLIAFGGFASALCPPTLDHGVLLEVLDSVEIPQPIYDDEGREVNTALLQEEQATAIGDALALAVDRLKHIKAKSKVIVLLSDGENSAGVVSPEDAAEAAAQYDIRVYCIGVGSTGLAPFPMVDRQGRVFLSSQPVRLDTETLKAIAKTTDGKYFNAKDSTGLRQVYTAIDELEKTEIEGLLFMEYAEQFHYPLMTALLLLVLCATLQSTWLNSVP